METKKIKFSTEGDKAKGGRNNTQTILTAAGVVSAGVAAGAAGGYAYGRSEKDDQGQAANAAGQTQGEEQQTQGNGQNSTTQNTGSNQSPENITEPQPTNNGQTAQNQQPAHEQPQNPEGGDTEADQIAQEIAQANEIDNGDIDVDDAFTVDGWTTAFTPDGTEMQVAVIHTPDGAEYMLADLDGDGVFNEVFDMGGNYVAEAEGDLTLSDLEEMADPTGGYLASNGDEPIGDDPTGDIIETIDDGPDDSVDIASNESTEEEISDEDLLAQLLDDDDDDPEEQVFDDDDDDDDLAEEIEDIMEDIDSGEV